VASIYVHKDQASQCGKCGIINFFTRDITIEELPIVIQCSKCSGLLKTSRVLTCKAFRDSSQNTGEWIIIDKPIREKTEKSLVQQLGGMIKHISNLSTELSRQLIESDIILREYKESIINSVSPKWEKLNYVFDIRKKELGKFIEFPFCVIRMTAYDEFIGNNSFLVLMPSFIFINIGILVNSRVSGYNIFIVNKYSKLSWSIPLGIVGIADDINDSNRKIPSVRVAGRKIFGEDVSLIKDEDWVERDIDYSDDNISLNVKNFLGYYKWCIVNGINPYENTIYRLISDAREEINIMLTNEQRLIADLFFKYYRINVCGELSGCVECIGRISKLLMPARLLISDNITTPEAIKIGCQKIKRRTIFDKFIEPDNDYSLIIIDSTDDPFSENELEYLCNNYHGPIINITNDLVLDTYTDNINALNMYAVCQRSYQINGQSFNCIANAVLEL
jgi:hypothetical protein